MRISGKYVGIILVISVLVVLTSGCAKIIDNFEEEDANSDNNTAVKTYSGRVNFNYPGSWQRHMEAIPDPELPDPDSWDDERITVENDSAEFQVEIYYNHGHSNQELLDNERNVSHSSDGWHEISNNTLTVDGATAYEYTMVTNKAYYGEIMRRQVICFFKNKNTYYLSFRAPNKDFDKEKKNFELIINSFKVQ